MSVTRTFLALGSVGATVALVCASSAFAMHGGAGSTPRASFVASTGSDHNPCTSTAPCLSFDRAFRAAPCGGSIIVESGEYALQAIGADPTKAGCRTLTVFTPEAGGYVRVDGGLSVQASYVKILGSETSADARAGRRVGFDVIGGIGVAAQAGATSAQDSVPDHVWIERTNSMSGYIAGATNVTFKGTNIGPAVSCNYGDTCAVDLNNGYHEEDLFVIRSRQDPDGTVRPDTNAVLDGVYLHDLTKVYDRCSTYPVSCSNHADCIQVYSFDQLTITNSTFSNCSDTDFFVKNDDGPWAPFRGLSIVNNYLGSITYPTGYYDAQIVNGCDSVSFEYNVVIGHNVVIGCKSAPSATSVEGNILPSAGYGACAAAVWRYNFFSMADASPCYSTDSVDSPRVFAQLGSARGTWLTLRYIVVAGAQVDVRLTVFQGAHIVGRITLPNTLPLTGRTRLVAWQPSLRPGKRHGAYRFCASVAAAGSGAQFSAASCAAVVR